MFGPRAATLTHVTAYLRELIGLGLLVAGAVCAAAAVGLAVHPAAGMAVAAVALAGLGLALTLAPAKPVENEEGHASPVAPLRDEMIA